MSFFKNINKHNKNMPAKRKIIKIKSHYEKLFKSSCKNFKNDECEKNMF